MFPPMVVLPTPPTVSVRVVPVTADSVRVPPSLLTRDAAATVIVPVHALLLARFRSAPPDEMPVPFKEIGSASERPDPLISTAAPDVTLVAPEVAPRAAFDCTWTTPAETVVAPL